MLPEQYTPEGAIERVAFWLGEAFGMLTFSTGASSILIAGGLIIGLCIGRMLPRS